MMKKTVFCMIFGLFIGGCFGGYSPTSRFYQLQAESNLAAVSAKKFSLGIEEVSLPDYLDKPQIIVMEENSPQMSISELQRWGEPLESMIRRTVVADMALLLPEAMVKSQVLLSERFDYLAEIQIVRFDMIAGQKAVLEAWWYLYGASGQTLYRQKVTLEEPIGNSFDDYVSAESKMLAEMSRTMAEIISSKVK